LHKDRSFVSRFKYDIAVLVVLALVGVGVLLNHFPFSFDAEDAEVTGETPPQIGNGEVLLVVPDGDLPEGEWDDLDFSFAWYNSLAQEIGPFSLQVTGAFAPDDLQDVTLAVIPARSAVLLEPPQIALLQGWIERGGSVIVEMPGPSWSQITGITEPVLVGRSAKAVTAVSASPLQGEVGEHLLDVPLHSRMLRLDTVELPDDVGRRDVMLEIDGVPVHFHRPLGDGHVYVVAFDFGMAITALQQGMPERDFTILPPEEIDDELGPDAAEEEAEDDEDDENPYTRPDVLVAHPRMRQTAVPYADLLERHVLYAPLRHRPTVRLWLFPETMLGGLVVTHEERGFGDEAVYMAEHEAELGLTSTYLVSATEMSNDGLDELDELGAEVGLAWHRNGVDTIYSPKGIGRLKPWREALSLLEQRERLEGWAGRRVHAVRVHELAWDQHYTRSFRKIAAAGLYMDTSYGPSIENEWGYLFGTGLPYYPIDLNGLPLPLYEFPFAISDAAGFGPPDEDVVTKLVKQSRTGFHNLVTLDIDADAMANQPRPETLENWMKALDLAREEEHWVTNLQEYALFYDNRRQAMIRTDFDAETLTLRASVDVQAQVSPREESPLPAPGLSVPFRFGGNPIGRVLLDGQPVEKGDIARTGDGVLAIVPITPGAHELEVSWAKE